MSFNTELFNLFLGMCKGVIGVPDDLRRLGYADRCIEFSFTNSRNEAVVPELIIASSQLQHSVLLEWKQGANTDADQLRRYAGVTSEDLREKAFLLEGEYNSHDTVIIGLAEHADRLVIGIEQGAYNFPVLVRSDAGLAKVRNTFTAEQTERVFQPRLEIDWATIPTYLYPLACLIHQRKEYAPPCEFGRPSSMEAASMSVPFGC